MADFIDLKVQFGVGPYHLNRFRVAFAPLPGVTAQMLAADFIANFPTYFSSQFATVQFTTRPFKGKQTLQFHGFMKVLGLDAAAPHNDWVVQEWVGPGLGFTAQTLQREFLEAGDAAAGLGGLIGVMTNQRHFLAGRRSWRLDSGVPFGLPATVMVLETAAIERFSARAYQLGDKIGGLEKRIPSIWMSNLTNFVNAKKLTVVPQPSQGVGWRQGSVNGQVHVDYVQVKADDLKTLQTNAEYGKVMTLYPTIIDLAAQPPGFMEKLERGLAI